MKRMALLLMILLGMIACGCFSTAPVFDTKLWRQYSTDYSGGTILWRAPDSVTPTHFSDHEKVVRNTYDHQTNRSFFVWWKGYDVNSWDYPTFVVNIDIQQYEKMFNMAPSIEVFRNEQIKVWTNNSCLLEKSVLGGRNWLKITVDYNDKLNDSRHVLFRTPLDREYYLTVYAEYDNQARKDVGWFAARQAIMSNIVESIRIERKGKP